MPHREEFRLMIEDLRRHVDDRIEKTSREIAELREQVRKGAITDKEAAERIEQLESGFEEIKSEVKGVTQELAKMNEAVSTFSPKLDRFFDNLWKVVFFLLAIVAGLVGIKLW